jgi:hypothetical protein
LPTPRPTRWSCSTTPPVSWCGPTRSTTRTTWSWSRPARGLNTTQPTLLTSGFSKLSEVVYAPGQAGDKALQYQWDAGSNTHRAILDRDGTSIVLSDWDNFIKLARPTQNITWSRFQGNCCNGEVRGVTMTPNGGYAIGYRIWNGASQIRFTDGQGVQTSVFSSLSDGTRLNLPYGVRSLSWPG